MPEFNPPAIGFPYNKMGQSASGILNDSTAGKFGPFANQLFVGDQTWSTVMRVCLEKVNGVYQGACFPFREGFGSGTLSLEMDASGVMLVGGTADGAPAAASPSPSNALPGPARRPSRSMRCM
jgi:hypothetical protein